MATLVVLPALVLSPLTAQAILIHDHHGHETHSHTLTFHDLDDWWENPEHQHKEHEHGGQPADPPEDDDDPIVIVFGLPDALMRVRGLSAGTVAVAGPASTPRAITATVDGDTCKNPSLYECLGTRAPNLRAGRIVASILLSNHALLL